MRMLDLFSGIGGFSLAASWVWGDELEIVAFCEIDKFCQKVLKKHWLDVPIIEDIREVTGDKIRGLIADTEREGCRQLENEQGKTRHKTRGYPVWNHNGFTIDLLTGGFPCQPFSCAGKRKGRADDRFLWPEMLRVIREVHPTWVIAENVGGLFTQEQGMVFGQVLSDLENEGYEVQPFLIPAVSKNAPHRRDRWWIVAFSQWARTWSECGEIGDKRRGTSENWREGIRQGNREIGSSRITSTDSHAADSKCLGWEKRAREGIEYEKQITERQNFRNSHAEEWDKNWFEVATRFCRVDDGVSNRLDFNLGRIGYGNTNNFRNIEEAISKISEYRRGILLNMWEQHQSTKASHRARMVGIYSGMSEMPHRDTHEEWYLGERIKESEELQNMWASILSKPFQETFDLQQEMLIGIGKKECNEKMETKRVNRLKSLGNAIVPQVAMEIMKGIRNVDNGYHNQSAR